MSTQNIEKYVEEFTRYISANCSKGGYPMPNNGRLFQFSHVVEVSQEWLRATLAKVAEEARKEEREKLLQAVQKAGTLFGMDIVVADELNNEAEIRGYERGMKHAKEYILKAIKN